MPPPRLARSSLSLCPRLARPRARPFASRLDDPLSGWDVDYVTTPRLTLSGDDTAADAYRCKSKRFEGTRKNKYGHIEVRGGDVCRIRIDLASDQPLRTKERPHTSSRVRSTSART